MHGDGNENEYDQLWNMNDQAETMVEAVLALYLHLLGSLLVLR